MTPRRAIGLLGSLFGALALGGCVASTGLAQEPGTQICSSAVDCPTGMSCNQGICAAGSVKGGGGGGGGADATGSGGGSQPDSAISSGGGGGGSTATSATVLCKSCSSDSDCGSKGFCMPDGPTGSGPAQFCGLDCSSASCPSGTTCYSITNSAGATIGSNCWPTAGYCMGFSGTGACASSSQCPTGFTCKGGTCMSTTTGGGTPPDAGVVTSPPDASVAKAIDSTPADPCGGHTWTNMGQAYMDNYCDGCHSSFGSRSGVEADASRIKSYIESGSMPPAGYSQPSSAENSAIIQWIDCGMPN